MANGSNPDRRSLLDVNTILKKRLNAVSMNNQICGMIITAPSLSVTESAVV